MKRKRKRKQSKAKLPRATKQSNEKIKTVGLFTLDLG
jgi:hypothetical protein